MTKMRLRAAGMAVPALISMFTPAFAQDIGQQEDEMQELMEVAQLSPTPSLAVLDEAAEIADAGPGGHEHGGAWHHHGILEGNLAVTDDQVEKLNSIHENYMESIGPKMLALHTAMHHIMDELGSTSIDTAKVKDLQSTVVSLKGDIARMQGDKLLAVANVFTPDQRHALREAMLRRKVGMMIGGHGHGMHGHHGGGGMMEHHEHP